MADLKLTWIHHASFRIESPAGVLYIDPWKIPDAPGDANLVLISHSHYDHLSADDVKKVLAESGAILGSPDVAEQIDGCQTLGPGQVVNVGGVTVRGLRAYNTDKDFHPRANDWLGLVLEVGDRRIYYAGDTDVIEEMEEVGHVDLALLPVGGTYTMDAEQAARAAGRFDADRIVPYHWGDIVGQRGDAEALASALGDQVTLLEPGDSLEIQPPAGA